MPHNSNSISANFFILCLDDGLAEMRNIAAERMLRHIAMCRRNWMYVGSRVAAEDICTRMMCGEKDFESLLPCDYKNSKAAGSGQAVA